MLPDIKLYYRAIVIKSALYWHKSRHIDRWNRIEIPEINACVYGQLIFNKGSMSIQWNKDSSINCAENWAGTCRKKEMDHLFTLYIRINSRWIKDLNITWGIINILVESIGSKILDTPRSIFLLIHILVQGK